MAAPIGKGDWVECVKAAPTAAHLVGRVFQVRDAGLWRGEHFVSIQGYPNPDGLPGWKAESFRPVYRPFAGAFDHLKAPPIRVRETEDA